MNKNRVRGYNKRFYPGVALLVAAALCLVFALTRLNVPLLQLQNKYFNLDDIVKNEDSILKVTGIDKNPVQYSDFGKWSLYIVSYLEKDSNGNETTQYIGLELDKDTAQQLIDKRNTLRDHPEKVAGTFVEPEFHDKKVMDYRSHTQDALKKYIKFPISRRYQNYVSIKPGKDTQKLFLILALVLFIPGLALVYLAEKHHKFATYYNSLFAGYENTEALVASHLELKGKRLSTLLNKSDYIDDKLGVYVYKNFFCSTGKGLEIYDLNKTKSVHHFEKTFYPEEGGRFMKSYLVFSTSDPNAAVRSTKVQIKNIGEETDTHLQPFFDKLRQDFPTIEIETKKESKR